MLDDQIIKKVRITRDNLPPISSDQEKYVVRYRIISSDRNRISHWSPQFFVSPIPIDFESFDTEQERNIVIYQSGASVIIKWNVSPSAREEFNKNPNLELTSYDVYLGWGYSNQTSTDPIQYYATSSGNYLTIPIPTPAPEAVRVVVQTITYPRQYAAAVAVADTGVRSFNSLPSSEPQSTP
jgi:hypothetical protein